MHTFKIISLFQLYLKWICMPKSKYNVNALFCLSMSYYHRQITKSHIIGIFILVNKSKQLQVYKNKTLISRMPTPSIKHHVTSSIFHRWISVSLECVLIYCWNAYLDWHGSAHSLHEYVDALPKCSSFSCLFSQNVVVHTFPHWLQSFGLSVGERVCFECFTAPWKIAHVGGSTMKLHVPL